MVGIGADGMLKSSLWHLVVTSLFRYRGWQSKAYIGVDLDYNPKISNSKRKNRRYVLETLAV